MYIVGGSASGKLSTSLAEAMDARLANVEIKRFPDGECYVRVLEDLRDQEVTVVQTTFPDPELVELFIILDAVNDMGPSRVTTVVPYYGYARQDKKFEDGEAVSARAFARLIDTVTDAFVTVDVHAPAILDWFQVPAADVSVMSTFGKFLKDRNVDLVLAPDMGALERAKATAEVIGCDRDFLEKTRIDGDTVRMAPKDLDVDGKVVAIVDDIIATGGTIIRATEALREQGAARVLAACAHGLYTRNALDRLEPVLDGIFSTDTIENPTTVVSAAGTIAAHLDAL